MQKSFLDSTVWKLSLEAKRASVIGLKKHYIRSKLVEERIKNPNPFGQRIENEKQTIIKIHGLIKGIWIVGE